MPDWMTESFLHSHAITWLVVGARLLEALVLGYLVVSIYRWTHHRNTAPAENFLTTLVLLTVIIAMSTQVIGDNVARAFSLVGALSIVRFRTVVQDTRDTAFVIFAVVVGMSVGAGYLTVALIGIPITGFAAYLMQPRERQSHIEQREAAPFTTQVSSDAGAAKQ
jgi:uncharacterized protein DUF4956